MCRLAASLLLSIGLSAGLSLKPSVAWSGDDVSFKAADLNTGEALSTDVPGLVFMPDGDGPFPAVVLMPHCHGIQSTNVRYDWPYVLNKNGYAVLTVDSFAPQGTTTCVGLAFAESRQKQASYAVGALNYLAARSDIDSQRIGVMGFSEGAFVINDFLAPESHKRTWKNGFAAAVTTYGGCRRLRLHSPADMPLLILAPEHDKRLVGVCISTAAASDHIYLQILKGAYHGFDNTDMPGFKTDNAGNVMTHSSSATDLARKYTVEFFDAFIGKNRGQKLQRKVMLGADQANEALYQWVSDNTERLCAMDQGDFAETLMELVEAWVSQEKVVPEMTVSKFKAKFIRNKTCS